MPRTLVQFGRQEGGPYHGYIQPRDLGSDVVLDLLDALKLCSHRLLPPRPSDMPTDLNPMIIAADAALFVTPTSNKYCFFSV